jgi:hypothetical protein
MGEKMAGLDHDCPYPPTSRAMISTTELVGGSLRSNDSLSIHRRRLINADVSLNDHSIKSSSLTWNGSADTGKCKKTSRRVSLKAYVLKSMARLCL